MIYVFIGQSGAGKTTAAKKLLPPPYEYRKDKVWYTIASNGNIGIGKYGIGKRTEGTDTLSYNSQQLIREQIELLIDHDIIIEGDRITNKKTFSFLLKYREKVKLFLVTCPVKESMRRLRSENSTITETFVKTTKTKSARLFLDYANSFKGEIINTCRQKS